MHVQFAAILLTVSCLVSFQGEALAQSSYVWPLSRTAKQSAPVTVTFGPRADANAPNGYSFHRGIDIPAAVGTPVYAIADGVVRLAGSYDYYSTPVVQLRHYKNSLRTCKNDGCFYSNYMHLSRISVTEKETVRRGQLIGFTGQNRGGNPHLHFEVRNAGVYRKNCAHPLTVLPYQNRSGPKLVIDGLKVDRNGDAVLEVTVRCNRNECDLVRIDAVIFEGARKKTERSYDMVALNNEHTAVEQTDHFIYQQVANKVLALPKRLDENDDYELKLLFKELPGVLAERNYQVRVRATDARRKSSDASRRVRADKDDRIHEQAMNALAAQR